MAFQQITTTDPHSAWATANAQRMAVRLAEIAQEFGEHAVSSSEPSQFVLAVCANGMGYGTHRAPYFAVRCIGMHDDEGQYQELPAHIYTYATQLSGARAERRNDIPAKSFENVEAKFRDFLEDLLPRSEVEIELLRIGADPNQPLALRVAALGKVIQTEADPWPPGLIEGYKSILLDANLDLIARIRVAFRITAYGDPLDAERVELLAQSADLPAIPEDIEIRLAAAEGGASGLERLVELSRHTDSAISSNAVRRLSWMAQSDSEPRSIREAAFHASLGTIVSMGHVFVSYVSQDQEVVDDLVRALRRKGVKFWRDKDDLHPGERWRFKISEAIRNGDAFMAVFSANSERRERSYMRQELLEAVDELKLRPQDRAWFIPVLISDCDIPEISIGAGQNLRDLQCVKLFEDRDMNISRLASALNAAIA